MKLFVKVLCDVIIIVRGICKISSINLIKYKFCIIII